MPEWWTYTLADFLMFSPRTYYRMIERHNAAVWPGHLLALALGVAIAVPVLRPSPGRSRAAAGVLAVLWAWIGSAFLLERYAAINWAARWFALLFAAQALLLVLLGVVRGRLRSQETASGRGRLGLGLVAVGLAAYPLLAAMSGRGWAEAEVFGVMPDPTAIVTLGWLVPAEGADARALSIIPWLWCLIAGLTLLALGNPAAALPFLAVLLAGFALVRSTLARPGFAA